MSIPYSLAIVQQEVKTLLRKGIVNRRQPIYALYLYLPAREWSSFEQQLEENNFLLRDRIGDLVPQEKWSND